jgi:hypothetical protein
MQIPCVYIPGPAPAVSVANNNFKITEIKQLCGCVNQYITRFCTLLLYNTYSIVQQHGIVILV